MKFKKIFSAGALGDFLALFAGAVTPFAFAPYHLFPISVISLSVLLGLWLKVSEQRAFWRGFLFGCGMFGCGVYWVYISIHTYGEAPYWLASIITALLIALLALFPAFTGYILNRYFAKHTDEKILFGFPAIWVVFEWIRSWIFTGFPWLTIGYSQISSPLRGYAPIFSVFGVSLATTITSAFLVKIVLHLRQSQYKDSIRDGIAILVIWVLGGCLSAISWTSPYGSPVKVSLVQGNIPQEVKWNADSLQPTLQEYYNLTQLHWDSKIIVWPESAIPISYQAAEGFLDQMDSMARSHNVTFITGIPIQVADSDNYYNAVITLGNGSGYYLKHRLVPFGEYVPLRKMLHGALDLLHIPMSDFIPATAPSRPLEAGDIKDIKIATFICYEIAYPELVLSRDDQINLLLTLSNDAWFGHSVAQAQHLEMGQMRALEMGRPLLFVSNNGITAIVKPNGKIQSSAPQYVAYVLTDTVQPTRGKTPWQRMGMNPILLILFVFVLISVRAHRGKR